MRRCCVVIDIDNVTKSFRVGSGFFLRGRKKIFALDEVSFHLRENEILGIVGESGSGKTTVARCILALTGIDEGRIEIHGDDIQSANRQKRRELRNRFAIVFQDPAANLNPRQRVKNSIMRPLILKGVSQREANKKAVEAMEKVKLDARYLQSFPHELSGGQQQRIAIARALVLEPDVMILDEPTSALDISVQAQILNLLLDLQEEMKMSYIIITHDLNVIRYVCDRVVVMYMGRVVEIASMKEIDENPRHPYTRMLLESSPVLDPRDRENRDIQEIGEAKYIFNPTSCNLVGRCPHESDICSQARPPLEEVQDDHFVACFLQK